MGYQYMAVYLFMVLMLIFCAVQAGKSVRKIAPTVRNLLYLAAFAVAANCVGMFSGNQTASMMAYAVMFSVYDWVLFFILKFCIECTGGQMGEYVKIKLMCALLLADNIQLLLNLLWKHAFVCREYILWDGSICYAFDPGWFYYVHLVLAYMILVFCFITLFYKAFTVPMLYSVQYWSIIIITMLIVILNTAYLLIGDSIDISMLFFAVEGLIIYYYALVRSQKKLLAQTHSLVVNGMRDAVLLFDLEGRCENINESAEQLFAVPKGTLENNRGRIEDWCRKHEFSLYEDYATDITEDIDGSTRYLNVQCQKLVSRNQRYLGSFLIIHDRTEEVERHREETYRATHDSMTGLYNRDYFFGMAERKLKSSRNAEFFMICLDVKNFKIINDVFGKQAGDKFLIRISQFLRENMPEDSVYGRLVNDRFGLLISKDDFDEQKITDGIESIAFIDTDEYYPVNIHLGVYEVLDRTLTISAMYDRAMMALESIKDSYEKKIAYYDTGLRENALHEQKLVKEIEEALEKGQFVIHLQPQIDASGKVLGGEALVRWQHPEMGLIMPGRFIGVMEKCGMIADLDRYVWELACKQLKEWKEKGREQMYISVNISPKDFYFMNIYDTFIGLIEQYDISPKYLKLEITETAVMNDLEKQLKLINRLRDAGFVIEMDDFGSGYSSLNMLKDIKVDMLKIDMAFLGKTEDDERAKKILKIMVELSKQLDMPSIVEGVETVEQVEFLKEIGCDIFQGYYFARPMEISAFESKYM